MGYQSSQHIVNEMLKRKAWQQAQLIKTGEINESTLSRLMRRLHCPQANTLDEMLDALGTPAEILYIPRLEK